MSENEQMFIKEFRKQIIGIFVAGVIMVIVTAIGFYYTTNNAINNLAQEQSTLKTKQDAMETMMFDLSRSKIDKSDYVREVDEMKQLLRDLNRKIDRITGS